MKIFEAKSRIKKHRLIAAAIMVTMAILFFCAALKSIYISMAGDTSALSPISAGIQRIVRLIYNRTQFFAWFWEWAPVITPKELNTPGNLGFLFIAIAGAIGRMMWDSAANLSVRIAKTILKVEELGWEQELMTQRGQVLTGKPDVLQINIELKQEDEWYKRPTGLLLLGVATALLGQLANLKFGFVKL
jgi:hypothetical protein